MKKNLNLMLGFALASTVSFVSCKKEKNVPIDDNKKLTNMVNKKMGLPGQSNVESYLVQQADGTYQAAWAGDTFIFGDNMPHKVINVIDGEPIQSFVFAATFPYNDYSINGPYFIVDRPQIGSSFNVSRQQLTTFMTAYNDHVQQNRDETGALKQPSFPSFDSYVVSNSNLVKGMIVSSNSSPSKMSIVPANFIPVLGIPVEEAY